MSEEIKNDDKKEETPEWAKQILQSIQSLTGAKVEETPTQQTTVPVPDAPTTVEEEQEEMEAEKEQKKEKSILQKIASFL